MSIALATKVKELEALVLELKAKVEAFQGLTEDAVQAMLQASEQRILSQLPKKPGPKPKNA